MIHKIFAQVCGISVDKFIYVHKITLQYTYIYLMYACKCKYICRNMSVFVFGMYLLYYRSRNSSRLQVKINVFLIGFKVFRENRIYLFRFYTNFFTFIKIKYTDAIFLFKLAN